MFCLSTIQRWCAHYRNGILGCKGDPHNAGRKSIEGRTETVVQMIENDRTLLIRDIELLSGIPKSSVSRILVSKGYRSVVGVWVPTVLSDANKQRRKENAQLIKSCLAEAGEIIEDETWIYHEYTYRSVDRQVRVKAGESRPVSKTKKYSEKINGSYCDYS